MIVSADCKQQGENVCRECDNVALTCHHKCQILAIFHSELSSLNISSDQDLKLDKNEERQLGAGFNDKDFGMWYTWV